MRCICLAACGRLSSILMYPGGRGGGVFTTIAVHVCVSTAVIKIISLCSMLWKKLLSELMDIYIQIPTRNRISYSSPLARTQLK